MCDRLHNCASVKSLAMFASVCVHTGDCINVVWMYCRSCVHDSVLKGQLRGKRAILYSICVFTCASTVQRKCFLKSTVGPFSGYLYVIALAKKMKNRRDIHCHMTVVFESCFD